MKMASPSTTCTRLPTRAWPRSRCQRCPLHRRRVENPRGANCPLNPRSNPSSKPLSGIRGVFPHASRAPALQSDSLTPIFWLSPLISVAGEQPEEQLQKLRQRFPEADLNKDGKLTREEMLEFRRQMRPAAAPVPPAAAAANETPAPANTTSSAGKVEIRVTSEKPVPINPKIYGINCAEMFIFDLVQKPEYLSALGELQLNTFSYPGGPSYYHHPEGSGGFNIRPGRSGPIETRNRSPGQQGRGSRFLPAVRRLHEADGRPCRVHPQHLQRHGRRAGHLFEQRWPRPTFRSSPSFWAWRCNSGRSAFKDSAAYIPAIKPYIEFLKTKYPSVRDRRLEHAGRPTLGGPRFIPAMEQGRRQSTRHRRLRAIRLDGVRRRGARDRLAGARPARRSSTSRTTTPSSRAFPQSRSRSMRRTGGPTKRCSCSSGARTPIGTWSWRDCTWRTSISS